MRDFLEALPSKAAQKVVWVLSLLEEMDTLTPAREIELAEEYRKDYLRRHRGHE